MSKIAPVFFHYVALSGYFGLFAQMMLWPTVLTTSTQFPVALVLIVTVTPLLFLVRGLLAFNPKSYAWAGFISLLYFAHGATEIYANTDARPLAAAEILFSLLLFFGSALTLRFRDKDR
ncbi:DUF2069 domain-containing protein [Methylomicrobium sp. Wu6]|uniref:DUF2069 domain-containing protein n=1 Tax=Methylomicrobium sp. Wu6 TaxID=3107928 RepID=UPI002DD69896|nr:DUF2069 domain-containing protein [Methylomicrobium sp. Wu6]MEC4747978.1 DUF2069 domain-containing protein [Methylomicrobium sp. Wu6]